MGFYSIYDRIIGNPIGDLLVVEGGLEMPELKGKMKKKYFWHTKAVLLDKTGKFSKVGKYTGFGRVEINSKEINVNKNFKHSNSPDNRPIALLQATVKAIKEHNRYNTLIKPHLKEFFTFLQNYRAVTQINNYENFLNEVPKNKLFSYENPVDSKNNQERIKALVNECISLFIRNVICNC